MYTIENSELPDEKMELMVKKINQDSKLRSTWGIKGDVTIDSLHTMLDAWMKENKGKIWHIFDGDQPIGSLGVTHLNDDEVSQKARLVFYLLSDYWGKGCSLQIIQAAIRLVSNCGRHQLLNYARKDCHSGKRAFFALGASVYHEDAREIQFLLNFEKQA